jgi:hypothetical protein
MNEKRAIQNGYPEICPSCGMNSDYQTSCCHNIAALKAQNAELLEALKACHPPAQQEKHANYAGACGACVAIANASKGA